MGNNISIWHPVLVYPGGMQVVISANRVSERIGIVQVDAPRTQSQIVSHSPLVAQEMFMIVERDVSKLVKEDGVYSSCIKKRGLV